MGCILGKAMSNKADLVKGNNGKSNINWGKEKGGRKELVTESLGIMKCVLFRKITSIFMNNRFRKSAQK